MFAHRMDRVRGAMTEAGVDALLLSVGPDMPQLEVTHDLMVVEA